MSNCARHCQTICGLVFLLACGTAWANPIGLSGFSGSETLIVFDTFGRPTTSPIVDYAGTGVTITESGSGGGHAGTRIGGDFTSSFDNIPGASGGSALADFWTVTFFTFDLPAGQKRAGLLAASLGGPTDFNLAAFDVSGALLGSVTGSMPNADDAVFLGLEFASDIARIELTEPLGDDSFATRVDDLRFEAVPEPATATLLLITACGFAMRRRG